jgi:hypothetical protein
VKRSKEWCSHGAFAYLAIGYYQASAARVNYSPTRERVFILQTVR